MWPLTGHPDLCIGDDTGDPVQREHGAWHTPGDGGSPPAATQAISAFVSPAKSTGAGSVRKATIIETSQEGKTGSQPSQRTATGVSAGNNAAAERGTVASPPPPEDQLLAAIPDVENDETQAPGDDMEYEDAGLDPGEQGRDAEHHDGDGAGDEALKDGDAQEDGRVHVQLAEAAAQEGSQQGDRPQPHQEAEGGAPDGDAAVRAQDSELREAPMLEDSAAPDHQTRPVSGAANGDGGTSHSAADANPPDSDLNSYYCAPGGQAQADTLIASSMAVLSGGNSLGMS